MKEKTDTTIKGIVTHASTRGASRKRIEGRTEAVFLSKFNTEIDRII
jgi:hypothetical protein